MTADDPIVTIEHVRQTKLCVRGAKMWFSRCGLDFAHFLREGYPASVIEGTGDALGKAVAQRARDAAAGEVD